MKKFNCIRDCSDCCIYREFYPSVEYGKIGVLILPEEKAAINRLARKLNIKLRIIPRLAIGMHFPENIIAYQMMGKNEDGNLCPFLDVESNETSPHGGFKCRIYSNRPSACRAYPVIDAVDKTAKLDAHCQFCKKFSTTKASSEGLQQEIEALAKIRARVTAGNNNDISIWRYATATGRSNELLPEGWVVERY
ncbi:MAG: YkgJ family cysteine cluster protein [Thermoproteota archaeon]|jgi:Fe-S-cluster containining protein|nr:YkgJ family cysteine cluster protein [Thermoproteota archaeon]